jgi:hypothetical protein
MKTLKEIRGTLRKKVEGKLPDPPTVLVIRRKAIRFYPNGKRIALYHNDKFNLDISVPYFPGKFGGEVPLTVKEELQRLNETIIKKLETIIKNNQNANVVLGNGASVQVQPVLAKRILDLYNHEKLTFKNKHDFSNFVSGNPADFKKVVDFVSQQQ